MSHVSAHEPKTTAFGGFAFILVLFILLAIISVSFWY